MNYRKALVNVRAYMGKGSYIEDLISMCNLEPTKDWKVWVDNNGYSLILNKNRKAICKKSNYLNGSEPKITDIYFKSKAQQIAENSKVAMFSLTENNDCFLWFLGIDNRLRSLSFIDEEWQNNSPPLVSGINSLKTIIKNKDISGYKVIMGSKGMRGPYEGNVVKSWISEWPPPNDMKIDLMLTNKTIGKKVLNDCGEM